MVRDGEAVGLVTDFLHEVEDRGAAVQDDGLVFLPVDVDDLFFFGDGGERLEGDPDLFKRGVGGVELAEAAVYEDERGEEFFLVEQAFVATLDDFTHAGEVVIAGDGFDLEFAVVGLLHGAIFPDDHGGYGFCALDVGDVEALDAGGELSECEGVLQGLLNGFLVRLEDAEALVIGLLGVLADEVYERAFIAALGGGELNAMLHAL